MCPILNNVAHNPAASPISLWIVRDCCRKSRAVLAVVFTFGILAAPYLLFHISKKYLIVPRLGFVQFGAERQRKRKKLGLVMALSVLGTAVLVAITASSLVPTFADLPEWALLVGLIGVKLILVFSLIAYYLDFPRAYLYGWFYALSIPDLFRHMDSAEGVPELPILFAGLMIVFGSVLFVQFLRKYPLPEVVNG